MILNGVWSWLKLEVNVIFEILDKIWSKIDKRRERYIETLTDQLIMAKQIIKNPRMLKIYEWVVKI